MSDRTAKVFVGLLLIALVAACATGRNAPIQVPPAPTDVAPPGTPNPCLVVPHPEVPRDTVVVVVEPHDRSWEVVRSDAAAVTAWLRTPGFLFAQMFPPLERVTCDGRRVVRDTAQRVGPFFVDSIATRVGSGTTVLRPIGRTVGPTILSRADTVRDQRDLIDSGVDILQTRDPAILDYARRGALSIHPLPFDRTYALAIPSIARSDTLNAANRRVAEADAATFRSALAREAIRVEARAATSPIWWQGLSCADSTATTTTRIGAGQNLPPRIMYDAKDPVARSIAERLVAIARRGAGNASDADARVLAQLIPEMNAAAARSLTAAPVDEYALRAGAALAFVIPAPARVLAPCDAQEHLRRSAEWLSGNSLFPLVETRSFLITRTGAPAVVVDWDGTLRIQPTLPVRRLPQR